MRLYLIRHARPLVQEGMCYGSADLPADEDHQRQVLVQRVPVLPASAIVFSSPLKRCRSLAEGIASALGVEPVFDTRLVEMHFGAWELQTWNSIPRADIDAWAADLLHYRPGNGECLLEVARRVKSFHASLHARKANAAVVVAHAGTIRLLQAAMHAGTAELMATFAASAPNRIAYGELTIVNYQTDNKDR